MLPRRRKNDNFLCWSVSGDVNMWSLGMMIQSGKDNIVGAALPTEPGRKYGNFISLQDGNQVFTLSSHFTVQPHLYTKRPQFYYAPLLFKEYLNKIGRTSLEVVRELYVQHSGMKLCQCIQGLVMVNRDHKPTPHPEWYINKYSHVKSKITFVKYTPVDPPTGGFQTQMTVQWSDTDYNYHTNQFSYTRFVVDAFHQAVYAGVLPGFEGDPTNYKIKTMNVVHSAQSAAGDKLTVTVWADPAPERIHFCVNNSTDVAYQGSFEFFPDFELIPSHL